jgi:hypothetical protein
MVAENAMQMWLRYRLMDFRSHGVYSTFANHHQCIFIHIPKAAGTSIAKTLFGQGSRHVPYFEYERANRRKFNRYFKFTFVRNPWDRLVSTFFFMKHGGINEMDRQWAEENLAQYEDFRTFVHEWVNEENIWSWAHFKPQHYFICDESLNLKMDFVGRFENIDEDFATVAARLNHVGGLAKANKGEHKPFEEYYTPAMRDIVAQVYRSDIDVFGYQFRDSAHLDEKALSLNNKA